MRFTQRGIKIIVFLLIITYLALLLLLHIFACDNEGVKLIALQFLFLIKCGQGSTDDELSPICVSSLLGIRIESVAAGLWHTVCISADGDVYAFGGNQFGQLGTGADQAEVKSEV